MGEPGESRGEKGRAAGENAGQHDRWSDGNHALDHPDRCRLPALVQLERGKEGRVEII